MVGPIRFDGPVSGIDFTSIINQLLTNQRRPETFLKARIDQATTQKNSLLEVNVALLALQSSASTLSRPSFFGSSRASSSNASVLTATGTASPTPGAYSFTVRRLAQAHQLISNGYPDSKTTPVAAAAGSISLELGGGFLDRRTPVSFLNKQAGFDRGSIKVTDSSGRSAVVNLAGAVDVQDLVDAINASSGVSVSASVSGNRIVLQDLGGGAGTLKVEDFGPDATASSLGIAGTGTLLGGAQYLFGKDINAVEGGTALSRLNDGLGVRHNSDGAVDFTVTDTDGVDVLVDIRSSDDTLQKVVDRINLAATGAGSSLTAALSSGGNSLVLLDVAGTSGLTLTSAADSFAAADLALGSGGGSFFAQHAAEDDSTGLAGGAANRIVGGSLIGTLNSTLRSLLHGGQSRLDVADSQGLPDGSITLTDRTGAAVTVDVSREVATTVSASTATSLTVADPNGFAVGNRFRVQTSSGLEYRTVSRITGNVIDFDRPLIGTATAGNAVYALNDSIAEIVRTINGRASAAGAALQVGFNRQGNGLQVKDASGGSGLLKAENGPVGSVADDLGIAGSVSADSLNGSDLDVQYLGVNTTLKSLNGGQGVAAGKFRVIDTAGLQFTVDLSQADDTTLGKVLQDFNGAASSVGSGARARINDSGDGLLILDTTPGVGTLRIQELDNGRTAKDLNIAGTAPVASPAKIDGSFEFSVAIAAGSKLEDVAKAINDRGVGVSATVVNDGSPVNGFHLVLTSRRAGSAGRITADSTLPGLSFSTSSLAQDAVLLSGGAGGGADPVVITSSQNTVTGVVPGLTLTLGSASDTQVTITVARDQQAVVDQVQRFVDSYNAVIQKISSLSFFDPDTGDRGPLFSDSSVRQVRRQLSSLVVNQVQEVAPGGIRSLSTLGISVTSVGSLAFNSSKLSEKLDSDFEQVENLFILQRKLQLSTPTKDLNNGRGISQRQGSDFTVTARDGTTFTVDLAGATTVSSILQAINAASGNGGRVTAQISSDGFAIELLDQSATSTTPFSVKDIAGGTTASELKINKTLALGETVLTGGIIGLNGDPGVAARLFEALDTFTRSGDGVLAVRTQKIDDSVKALNRSIDRIEKSVQSAQDRLVQKFTNLEKVIAQSQNIQSRLSGLLASLTSAA